MMIWYTHMLQSVPRWQLTPLSPHLVTTVFVVGCENFEIYSLSNFEAYSTQLLTIVIVLEIRSPEFIHFYNGSMIIIHPQTPFEFRQLPSNVLFSKRFQSEPWVAFMCLFSLCLEQFISLFLIFVTFTLLKFTVQFSCRECPSIRVCLTSLQD